MGRRRKAKGEPQGGGGSGAGKGGRGARGRSGPSGRHSRGGLRAGAASGKDEGARKGTRGASGKGNARSPRGKGDARRGGLGEWLRSLAVAFVIFLFLRIFLLETYVIDSGSMEETLLVGDFVVVNKLAIGSRLPFTDIRIPGYSEPRRGDILVFDPHHEENMTIVKRVVGMPGDTLEMRAKALYLNGELHDEPYVETIGPRGVHEPEMRWQNEFLLGGPKDDYRGTWDDWGPLVVPAGNYFMMGDNRDDSIDSRQWGFLEGWRFKGRAAFVYFSYDRDSFKPFPMITEIRGSRIGDRVR